jgi:hypothetical protein
MKKHQTKLDEILKSQKKLDEAKHIEEEMKRKKD